MGSNSFCKKTNVRITDKMLHFTFNRCDQNDSSSKYVTLTILGGGAKWKWVSLPNVASKPKSLNNALDRRSDLRCGAAEGGAVGRVN